MCTVTFSPNPGGYLLAMNRDENRRRPPGLPPRLSSAGTRQVLSPAESGGGTWIATNDALVSLALLNWYEVQGPVVSPVCSRGKVVRMAIAADTPHGVETQIRDLPLPKVRPFRLIGVFPAKEQIFEWRWNSQQLEIVAHRWQLQHWASSGWNEREAQTARSRVFEQMRAEKAAGSASWLRRLHSSHAPCPGPTSVCMHRDESVTVSYTEVLALQGRAAMNYFPGSPCRAVPPLPHKRVPEKRRAEKAGPTASAVITG